MRVGIVCLVHDLLKAVVRDNVQAIHGGYARALAIGQTKPAPDVMLEPKMATQMQDKDVPAKRDVAIQWCGWATDHAKTYGGKAVAICLYSARRDCRKYDAGFLGQAI